eukprot:3602411-Pyramimonas_sp.AAC.1
MRLQLVPRDDLRPGTWAPPANPVRDNGPLFWMVMTAGEPCLFRRPVTSARRSVWTQRGEELARDVRRDRPRELRVDKEEQDPLA